MSRVFCFVFVETKINKELFFQTLRIINTGLSPVVLFVSPYVEENSERKFPFKLQFLHLF